MVRKIFELLGIVALLLVIAVALFLVFRYDSSRQLLSSSSEPAPSDSSKLNSLAKSSPALAKPSRVLISSHDVDNIEELLKSASPNDPQIACDTIRRLAEQQPEALAHALPHWIKPLIDDKQWDTILAVTHIAILADPANTPMVSDAQWARVHALLNLGRYDEALPEAKSLYNVATLKTTDRAIELVAEVLKQAKSKNDPGIDERFKQEQIVGASLISPSFEPSVLKSITVDLGQYQSVIETGGDDEYQNLMARGNLLLLVDKPAEAKRCFISASLTDGVKGKDLQAAVEGLARGARAEAGAIGPANAILDAARRGAVASPQIMALSARISIQDLQTVGKRIPIAKLPQDAHTPSVSAPGLEQPKIFQGRMQRPVKIVQSASPSDPDLVEWLKSVELTSILDRDRTRLREALSRSPLGATTMFELGPAVHAATDDVITTAIIYNEAARRAHDRLANDPSEAGIIFKAVLSAHDDLKKVLWERIDGASDGLALSALYTVYSDIAADCPTNDPELANLASDTRVGLSECLLLLGKKQEAIKTAMAIDANSVHGEQRAAVAWAKAIALLSKGRNAEAIPELESIVRDDRYFKYKDDAVYRLFLCYMALDRVEDAEALYRTQIAKVGETAEVKKMGVSLASRSMLDKSILEAR